MTTDTERNIDHLKAQFRDKRVVHPMIARAREELMATLNNPIDGQIIMVIGPPGVGKTTLRQTMVRDLNKAFAAQPDRNPGHIAVAGIELEAFSGGSFNWKKTRQELLRALHEPLINKKVMYRQGIQDNAGILQIDQKLSENDLGEVVIDTITARQPQAMWFDEGQHMTKVKGPRGFQNQMDTIKSLANRSGVPVVLFGAYEMNVLLELSTQLARRTKVIHLPRYRQKHEDASQNIADREAFRQVLLGFQSALPFDEKPDLIEHWDYFFSGSLGCIGNLKNWLVQAAGDALDQNMNTLSRAIIEKWRRSDDALYRMLMYISEDEKTFDKNYSRHQLDALMGLDI